MRGAWSWHYEDGWYQHLLLFNPGPDILGSVAVASVAEMEVFCNKHFNYYRPRWTEDYAFILYFKTQEDATLCKLAFGGEYIHDKLKETK